MKKLGALILLTLIILNLFIISAQSTDIEETLGLEGAEENVEKLEDIIDDPGAAAKELTQNRSAYLSQEWAKIRDNNPALGAINAPIKAFTGYDIDLSFAFFIALFLSLLLWDISFRGINTFYNDSVISMIIGLLIIVIANSAGLTKKIVPKILLIIDQRWKIYLFIIICIILIAVIDALYKSYKKRKAEAAIENLGESEAKLTKAAETLEGVTKGMEDVKKGADEYESGAGI